MVGHGGKAGGGGARVLPKQYILQVAVNTKTETMVTLVHATGFPTFLEQQELQKQTVPGIRTAAGVPHLPNDTGEQASAAGPTYQWGTSAMHSGRVRGCVRTA